jgi:hypothetical protein
MAVELERRGGTGTLDEIMLAPADRYVQLGEVLSFTRNHPPPRDCQPQTAADDVFADSCLYVQEESVRPYRLAGPLAWASYGEIRECFTRTRSSGRRSHIAPFSQAAVFASLKVVLADRDAELRAVLTPLAVYPRRGIIGTLVPWQDFRLTYAAVALLNSRVGLGLYRRALRAQTSRMRKGDGIDKKVLTTLPVACRGYRMAHLEHVASLCSQIIALHEAEEECGRSFDRQLRETHDRLLPAIVHLLGWPEYALERLARETFPENAQLSFDLDEFRMPSRPPVRLVEPGMKLGRVELKRLRYWEGAVNAPLPTSYVPGTWT